MVISLLMQMWLPARSVTALRAHPDVARLNTTVTYCRCHPYDRRATVDKKTPLPSRNSGTNRQYFQVSYAKRVTSEILDPTLPRVSRISQSQMAAGWGVGRRCGVHDRFSLQRFGKNVALFFHCSYNQEEYEDGNATNCNFVGGFTKARQARTGFINPNIPLI
jgi:hypothetical protein